MGTEREVFEANSPQRLARVLAAVDDGHLDVLALSGGGAGGAFGAGALVGLSRSGARPQFEIVTGVSSGALIAPFAFLGSGWDAELTQAYAGGASANVLESRSLDILFEPGVYRGTPLRDLVDGFVTPQLVEAVARESAKGRMLLVATTDLDRGETVNWDLGAIAARGGEPARVLFRDVLVASASIPALFPPVMIRVDEDGKVYEEMHVDGGASVPFFIAPEIAQFVPGPFAGLEGARVYVLINGQLGAPPQTTPVRTAPIAVRSFDAALTHMTRGAVALSAAFAERHGMSFHFSNIPVSYPFAGPLAFEAQDMRALFDWAAACAEHGRLWLAVDQALGPAAQPASAGVLLREPACPGPAAALVADLP
jgi:predicted acylesterase/phospholipase RssA